MFNKLKHIKELRDQAKNMQNVLADETITVEKSGVKITMNGNMEIISFTINEELSKNSLEGIIKEVFNDAIKKTQHLMAKKMQEIGGFPGL